MVKCYYIIHTFIEKKTNFAVLHTFSQHASQSVRAFTENNEHQNSRYKKVLLVVTCVYQYAYLTKQIFYR